MAAKLNAFKVELQRRVHDRVDEVGIGFKRSYRVVTNTMLFLKTSTRCPPSSIASIDYGETFWFVAVNPRERSGRNTRRSSTIGSQRPASCIPIPMLASTPLILRKSRMRRHACTNLSGGAQKFASRTGPEPDSRNQSHFSETNLPPIALSEHSQQIAHQQNDQHCTKSYACSPTCAPAAVAIVSSASAENEHQNNYQYDEHLRSSSLSGLQLPT
jgi:hypothetical protein